MIIPGTLYAKIEPNKYHLCITDSNIPRSKDRSNVQYRKHLYENHRFVTLYIKKLRNLASRNSLCSKYLEVSYPGCNGTKLVSTWKGKESNIDLNELFDINCPDDHPEIWVTLWEKGLFQKKNFLGCIIIRVDDHEENTVESLSLELNGIETGEIYFEMVLRNCGTMHFDKAAISLAAQKTSSPSNSIESSSSSKSHKVTNRERYKKIKMIGSGGQGSVYLAEDLRKNNRHVALKRIICNDFNEASAALKEFNQKLDHPNLIKYSDLYLEPLRDGTFAVCFVMPYYQEGDLHKYLVGKKSKKVSIPLEKIVNLCLQMAEAIQFLHYSSIIHRDIKPQNVFLEDQWSHLILADFGMLRNVDTTLLSTMCGSPNYMSPETAANIGYSYSADIWSVGCLFYEICTLNIGKVHYIDIVKNNSAYYESIRNEIVNKVESKTFGSQLAEIVISCLQYDPKDRVSAKDLQNSFMKLLEDINDTDFKKEKD